MFCRSCGKPFKPYGMGQVVRLTPDCHRTSCLRMRRIRKNGGKLKTVEEVLRGAKKAEGNGDAVSEMQVGRVLSSRRNFLSCSIRSIRNSHPNYTEHM